MTPATLERRYRAAPLVAHHEIGHAIIAYRLRRRVDRIVVGHARDSGQTDIQPTYDPYTRARILLAGERAERRSISWLDGFHDLHRGSEDRRGVDDALAELGGAYTVAELVDEVDERLRDDWRALKELATLLDRERVLDGAAVAAMLG